MHKDSTDQITQQGATRIYEDVVESQHAMGILLELLNPDGASSASWMAILILQNPEKIASTVPITQEDILLIRKWASREQPPLWQNLYKLDLTTQILIFRVEREYDGMVLVGYTIDRTDESRLVLLDMSVRGLLDELIHERPLALQSVSKDESSHHKE